MLIARSLVRPIIVDDLLVDGLRNPNGGIAKEVTRGGKSKEEFLYKWFEVSDNLIYNGLIRSLSVVFLLSRARLDYFVLYLLVENIIYSLL